MFHRSERLLLRPIWPEDWQSIKAGISDLAVLRHLASAPNPYTDDDAKAFAGRAIPALYPRFAITLADTARLVGVIGLDPNPQSDGEIGYWIARHAWGQGYATEAGIGVARIAHTLGYRRITAAHFVDNPASGKVLRKIGFKPTGTQRMQMSLGRGEEAPALEYDMELEDCSGGVACAA